MLGFKTSSFWHRGGGTSLHRLFYFDVFTNTDEICFTSLRNMQKYLRGGYVPRSKTSRFWHRGGTAYESVFRPSSFWCIHEKCFLFPIVPFRQPADPAYFIRACPYRAFLDRPLKSARRAGLPPSRRRPAFSAQLFSPALSAQIFRTALRAAN